MIYVTSVDNTKVEPLMNIDSNFTFDQSTDGSLSISMTCYPYENPGYDLLESETVVTVNDYNFRVKQFSKSDFSKSVVALSTFFDLATTRIKSFFSGSHTLRNHVSFALSGTGWTFTIDDSIASNTNYIDGLGNDNVIAIIKKICERHSCEYQILPGNQVHFAKELGPDNDYQYRYKHNVGDVVLKEDTTNLRTYIEGVGKDGLTVTYTSPNINIYGRREADPIEDDRFTNSSSLLNYIKSQLQDVPELAIESTAADLTKREIGERIWLIYEPLKIEMQTRILSLVKSIVDGELVTVSVVFGNTLIKSSIDLIVEQAGQIADVETTVVEAKKEYRSAITQTDQRITLEVEHLETSIATIDMKADNINLSVNNRITNEIAAIDMKADNISLTVNNRITNEVGAVDIKANQIITSVNNLSTNTSAAIRLLEDNINLKVDANGVVAAINLSPETVSIDARRINLNGATIVNGTLTGASTVNVTTDLYVGNNIEMRGSGGSMIKFPSWSQIYCNDNGIIGLQSFSGIYLNAVELEATANSLVGLAGSDTEDLFFALNADNSRLYIRRGGRGTAYNVASISLV